MPLTKRTAVSAGGLVIRAVAGRPEIVVGRRRRERDGYVWSLPKGTPEEGETREETALREVREESGLEVRILSYFAAISYSFVRTGERIEKTVHYYLMEQVGGSLTHTTKSLKSCAGCRWTKLLPSWTFRLRVRSSNARMTP